MQPRKIAPACALPLFFPFVLAGCSPTTNSPETLAAFKTFQDQSAIGVGSTYVTSYKLSTAALNRVEGTVSPKWYTLQPKDKRNLINLIWVRWYALNSPGDSYKSTVTLVDGDKIVAHEGYLVEEGGDYEELDR